MENVNLNNIASWYNIRKLYLSEDKESWQLADTILEQADNSIYKNQIEALLKVIPDKRSTLNTSRSWSRIIEDEICNGSTDSVQMLADIYSEYVNSIIFSDDVFKKFDIKLKYNG